MKKILYFLILGLLLSVNLKADDITEFQIEGISVGETLLNFMSLKEIKKAKRDKKNNIYYDNKSFVSIMSSKKIFANLKIYNDLYIALKTKDDEYIIHSLEGKINISGKDINTCYKEQQAIANEIEKAYPELNLEKDQFNIAKSKLRGKDKIVRYIDLELPKTISPGGEFRVSCNQYKDGKIHLFVIINSTEFMKALKRN
ncbi:hypothetical protein N9U89_00545 [Candidatus Pelagibacter sp.]|nr:hypothetical protein [Candidatus Pelagibacter sp.]